MHIFHSALNIRIFFLNIFCEPATNCLTELTVDRIERFLIPFQNDSSEDRCGRNVMVQNVSCTFEYICFNMAEELYYVFYSYSCDLTPHNQRQFLTSVILHVLRI